MEPTPEEHSRTLMKNIVEMQKKLIDRQNDRIGAYLTLIEYMNCVCRARGIEVPLEQVTSILQATNDEERQQLIAVYKTRLIHEVLDEFEQSLSDDESQYGFVDGFNSPEWDNGVYDPKDQEPNFDINDWKVFKRKWRLFGDAN